jgi:hypothetical protein
MLPLTEQRDLQHHEVVQVLMHLALPRLELALPLPVPVLQVLLQLRERLVVSELVQQAPVQQLVQVQQRGLLPEQKQPNSVLELQYLFVQQLALMEQLAH